MKKKLKQRRRSLTKKNIRQPSSLLDSARSTAATLPSPITAPCTSDGYEEEDGSRKSKGYIYTDRPVYRPNHKVNFKGILRAVDANGAYKPVEQQYGKRHRSKIRITPPSSPKKSPLSPRGTFAGDIDISEEAPLGNYNIAADVDGGAFQRKFRSRGI